MREQMTLNVDISAEDDGSFLARIREYSGCWASGSSPDEAARILLEMLPDYLEAFHGMSDVHVEELVLEEAAAGTTHGALVLA